MNTQQIKHIALCATARFTEETIVNQAKEWLEDQGFQVTLASNINKDHHQFAGDDDSRALAFQTLIDNKNIDAIWCLRGGYGSVRIIDKIDWSTFREFPKYLIGFSDFTVILSHVLQFNTPSIHSPMPIQFPSLKNTCKQRLIDILKGEFNPILWEKRDYSSDTPVRGNLIGGNLSMLYSLIGSESFPNTQNTILFIEDLDEYSYHLDRMMYTLFRSGSLKGVKGILVGSFTAIHDHKIPFGESYVDIFTKFAELLNVPIYFHFPAGHIDNNKPIVLGKQISISPTSGNQFVLRYDE